MADSNAGADLLDTDNVWADNKTATNTPQDLLLVIFIHGFQGSGSTFAGFPGRLQHMLSETISNLNVECIIFPTYETKGELNAAVVRFADWLTNLTVEREVANGGGAGKAKIILCGHSMGGLLAADTLREFVRTRPDQSAPLWPNIVACLAYDTPYFGLHPGVFKHSAAGYVRSAQDILSSTTSFFRSKTSPPVVAVKAPAPAIAAPPVTDSPWKKWAPAAYAVGGALLAGAAAGTAYYKRDEIGVGYNWATDHMKYVGSLWDEQSMRQRVDDLLELEDKMGVMFRNFYTFIPPAPPTYPSPRTFMILPKASSPYVSHFLQAPNSIASDEIEAHTGIFDGKTNDGYYELGLITAQLIRDVMISRRSGAEDTIREAAKNPSGEQHAVKLSDDSAADAVASRDVVSPAHVE